MKNRRAFHEQNENMIDGVSTIRHPWESWKPRSKPRNDFTFRSGAAVKNESRTERGKSQKKPSIRAQLKADKDTAARKQEAKNKNLEREV